MKLRDETSKSKGIEMYQTNPFFKIIINALPSFLDEASITEEQKKITLEAIEKITNSSNFPSNPIEYYS